MDVLHYVSVDIGWWIHFATLAELSSISIGAMTGDHHGSGLLNGFLSRGINILLRPGDLARSLVGAPIPTYTLTPLVWP